MLNNGNDYATFNDFRELPQIPYKILETLLLDNSQLTEDFWKILYYADVNSLDKPNLSFEQKNDLIWKGDTLEQDYQVFVKPLVGSSLDTAEAQTQIRIYRNTTMPESQYEATICIEIDFITNEKTPLVYQDGILCERTDLLESMFLTIMNGRDIGIGSGYITFNREFSRSCNSQLGLGNSKTFYGRALTVAMSFVGAESGGKCG